MVHTFVEADKYMLIGPTLGNKINQWLKRGCSREVAQRLMKQWIINIAVQEVIHIGGFPLPEIGCVFKKKIISHALRT